MVDQYIGDLFQLDPKKYSSTDITLMYKTTLAALSVSPLANQWPLNVPVLVTDIGSSPGTIYLSNGSTFSSLNSGGSIAFRTYPTTGAINYQNSGALAATTTGTTNRFTGNAPAPFSAVSIIAYNSDNVNSCSGYKASISPSGGVTPSNVYPCTAGVRDDTQWQQFLWSTVSSTTLSVAPSTSRTSLKKSDLLTIASVARDDILGAPPLYLLSYYFSGTCNQGYYTGYTAYINQKIVLNPLLSESTTAKSGDFISAANAANYTSQSVANSNPIPIIEFTYGSNKVFTVAAGGDSTVMGALATGNFGAVHRSILGSGVSSIPTAILNCAVSGYTSAQYYLRLMDILAQLTSPPCAIFYEVMTYNDNAAYTASYTAQAAIDQGFANLVLVYGLANNVPVILATPLPFQTVNTTPNVPWQNGMNANIAYINSVADNKNVFICDYSIVHQDTTTNLGNWKKGLDSGGLGVHPNEFGTELMHEALQPKLLTCKAQYI